jgi:hypothetical protein
VARLTLDDLDAIRKMLRFANLARRVDVARHWF